MSSFILLSAKGAIKSCSDALGDSIEQALGKALKRAKPPQLIGSWTWLKYKLFLYGYKEGRAGTENKHELPPPNDEVQLFSDACIVASLEKSPEKSCPFSVEQYKKFYNTKFGGLEEEDGEEEEEEEDEEEEDFDEDYDEDGVDEEEDGDVVEEEEEEEERPVLKIKPSAGFKKIAKWMHSPELKPEEYVL